MARVVLQTGLAGIGFSYAPGATVDMDDDEAERRVAAGQARYEGDKAAIPRVPGKPQAKPKPAAEPEADGKGQDAPADTGATDGAEAGASPKPPKATRSTRKPKAE